MTRQTLARARAGDEDAFRDLTDPHRRELQVHIYRIVGSAHDAEDLLQETLLAAWRGLEVVPDAGLSEVDYGDWTNRELRSLFKEPLWTVVQQHPSAAVFPAGEGLADHVIVTRSQHIPRIQEAQASAWHVLRELIEHPEPE